MDNDRRIIEGSLPWEVLRFGGPLALGMALQTTFNLADAYLIAQLPMSEVAAAVGALGLCDQLAALGTIASYGISTAAAILVAQAKGRGDTKAVERIAWQSSLFVIAMSVVFGFAGVFGSGVIVRGLIGAKGDVAEQAIVYSRAMIGGSYSIFLLLHVTTLMRALGSSKTPVGFMLLGNVLNVFFAILFLYGGGPGPAWASPVLGIARTLHIPHMGMIGAALATILTRTAVLIPVTLLFLRRFRLRIPTGAERKFDRVSIKELLTLAWPTSVQFLVRIAAMLAVNSLVARFFTTETDQTASTAMGLVFRLDTFSLFVAMGWGSAAQTFAAQNVGAHRSDRAKQAGVVATVYGLVTSIGLTMLAIFAGPAVLRMLGGDEASIAIAMDYLRRVAPTYFALGSGIVLGNALAGAGRVRTTLAVDLGVLAVLQVPLAFVAAVLSSNVTSIFAVVAAANIVCAVAYVVVYAKIRWMKLVPTINRDRLKVTLARAEDIDP